MTVTRRPETPDDEPFLRGLIIATVAAELGADAWPEPLRGAVLPQQYRVRRHAARIGGPIGKSDIILIDGLSAGWLALVDAETELRILDIMVAPERRGQGVGAVVLQSVIDSAAGRPVRLSVNVTNARAVRLYERLGFRRIGGDQAQHEMEYA